MLPNLRAQLLLRVAGGNLLLPRRLDGGEQLGYFVLTRGLTRFRRRRELGELEEVRVELVLICGLVRRLVKFVKIKNLKIDCEHIKTTKINLNIFVQLFYLNY